MRAKYLLNINTLYFGDLVKLLIGLNGIFVRVWIVK
jgi:hypothetical protein